MRDVGEPPGSPTTRPRLIGQARSGESQGLTPLAEGDTSRCGWNVTLLLQRGSDPIWIGPGRSGQGYGAKVAVGAIVTSRTSGSSRVSSVGTTSSNAVFFTDSATT